MQFTVGLKTKGKSGRIVVDAEDALTAALKVKTEQPEVVVTSVLARHNAVHCSSVPPRSARCCSPTSARATDAFAPHVRAFAASTIMRGPSPPQVAAAKCRGGERCGNARTSRLSTTLTLPSPPSMPRVRRVRGERHRGQVGVA